MSDAPELIEAIAKQIYVAMAWAAHCGPPPDGVVPPWSDRGNSHGQTEARAAARLVADLVPDPAAIRAEALEEAAAVVGALVHVDDTSEYQQGVLDAEEAIRALIAQPAEGGDNG